MSFVHEKIRIVIYGLGPIGMLIARKLLEREDIEIAGCIEISPDKVGKDLGEVLGLENLNIKIVHDKNALEFLLEVKPDIVILATGTYLESIYPQIVKCIKAKANVISTSETLAYPWYRYSELATLIDEAAKRNDVAIIGTGVNPGFIFDTLPAFLTAVCSRVDYIEVIRSINASKRRYSFQKKIGLGLSLDEFEKMLREGKITGHVGYAESILLLSSLLNVKIDHIEERQEPIIAERPLKTDFFNIEIGRVCGVKGIGIGYVKDKKFIRVKLVASVDVDDYDEVIIKGDPPQRWKNELGTSGDIATAGMIINIIPKVLKAPKGLITMKDLMIPSYVRKITHP